MMKNIRTLGTAAAALAASAVLIAPALAQQASELDGAPRLFAGQNYDRDRDYDDRDRDRDRGRDWDRDRDRRPDFQTVQRDCSIAGIREAWNSNFYSAQYHEGPKLEYGRDGWEMRGKMRLHDRKGYYYVDTYCDVERNGNVRIRFGRGRR